MKISELEDKYVSATADEALRIGVKRSIDSFWEKRIQVLREYRYISEVAERVREVKEYSINNLDKLLRKAMEKVHERGGEAYFAKDRGEALKILREIVGEGKVIVKSKTLTGDELGIREYLERVGNEVWETDLGELLIQLSNSKPMHMVAPALHIPRELASELLVKKLKLRIEGRDAREIVSAVRGYLRDKFIKAEVGISGANAFAADTASIFIIENEGNARLCTALPEKHVAIVGVEKIVPTRIDAFQSVEVATFYSGIISTYINVISSPSKTADIEHEVVMGAQGPRELHVVFVDNGRFNALSDSALREALYCVRCGACQFMCPLFSLVAGVWGGDTYTSGIGVLWTAIVDGLDAAGPLTLFCFNCGRCSQVCPLKIRIPEMINEVRSRWLKGRLDNY